MMAYHGMGCCSRELAPANGPLLGDGPRRIATIVAKRSLAPGRRALLSRLDAGPLLEQDARWASMPALKSDPRVGVIRTFHEVRAPARLRSGAPGVATLPDGTLVWAAEVESKGAVGLRLRVSRCDLPRGATIVVYDADEPQEAYGPFDGRSADDTGAFFLPTVFGETARVEVRVPARSSGARLRFAIDRVAQRYRERGETMEDPRVGTAAKASACNNNVACDASYAADVARAVATMEITSSTGVFVCTGALLNDSSVATSIPYFLTAHHCLSLESEAKNTEFYFDYRAATCDGSPPALSSVPRVVGATVLATSSSTDFTLLKLTGTLPANRFFCGWTATRQATGQKIVGVHHPAGTQMRISYGTLLDPDGNFHEVEWSSGVTAGGSSGSPLFNADKQIIGQLYGGSSSCSFQSGLDEYGRFDRTYPSVSQYLGQGVDAFLTDAYDPADDAIGGATLLVPGVFGSSHGPHSLSNADAADWYALDLGAGARYHLFSTGSDDVRATLYSDALGNFVAASDDDSGGSLQFSLDFTAPAAGRYRLAVRPQTVTAAAEYALNFVQVDDRRTTTPARVARLRRSVNSGTVTLKWKDRARNEAGYFVDLSDDNGVRWNRVAELPQDAHELAHEPGPGAHLYRVGAWNASPSVDFRIVRVDVADANQLDAFDPLDDTGQGAVTLSPAQGGITSARSLSRSDTEDWFRITLTAGSTYAFSTSGAFDTYGELFEDSIGFSQETSDDNAGAGRNFRLGFTAPRTATYWLRVTAFEEGDLVSYVLEWSRK